jgi:hypothetical protein
MFDIFSEEKEQPKLYIVDMEISVSHQVAKNSKHRIKRSISLTRIPLTLNDKLEFPTERSKNKFFKRVFDEYIDKGNYDTAVFKVESITNAVFSSKLSYFFDYLIH